VRLKKTVSPIPLLERGFLGSGDCFLRGSAWSDVTGTTEVGAVISMVLSIL
jgi:hypothetical protein